LHAATQALPWAAAGTADVVNAAAAINATVKAAAEPTTQPQETADKRCMAISLDPQTKNSKTEEWPILDTRSAV
jgi:hypothetical protein